MDHFVYRCYDVADRLLYVGVTSNLPARLARHRGESPWWAVVARLEADGYGDRAEADRHERHLIRIKRPVHNRQITQGADRFAWEPCVAERPGSLLADIAAVFDQGDDGLWLQVVLERLLIAWPDVYASWDVPTLGSQLRTNGVRPVSLHRKIDRTGITRKGIRREQLGGAS